MVKKKKEGKSVKNKVKIDSFEQKFQEREELIKKEQSGKSAGKNYLGLLVFLIILILVVDSVSLIVYYKPKMDFIKNTINNLNGLRQIGLNKCSDGTIVNTCSKNKSYYCYEGNLVQKAYTCGCPSGYKVDFQSCVNI
jgi:hypothetical protein